MGLTQMMYVAVKPSDMKSMSEVVRSSSGEVKNMESRFNSWRTWCIAESRQTIEVLANGAQKRR